MSVAPLLRRFPLFFDATTTQHKFITSLLSNDAALAAQIDVMPAPEQKNAATLPHYFMRAFDEPSDAAPRLSLHKSIVQNGQIQQDELAVDFEKLWRSLPPTAFSLSNSALLKAVKLKDKALRDTTVFDCTGGLGREAFVLVCFGGVRQVISAERNPALCLLLLSALNRALSVPILEDIAARMSFRFGDSTQILREIDTGEIDIAYVDTMFETELAHSRRIREGKSKPKHDIAFVRDFLEYYDKEYLDPLSTQSGLADVVRIAAEKARRRVVIKRPSYAPQQLAGMTIDYSVTLKDTRFDVINTSKLKKQV